METPYNTNDNDTTARSFTKAGTKYKCPECGETISYMHNNENDDSGYIIMCSNQNCDNTTEHTGEDGESFLSTFEGFKEKSTL